MADNVKYLNNMHVKCINYNKTCNNCTWVHEDSNSSNELSSLKPLKLKLFFKIDFWLFFVMWNKIRNKRKEYENNKIFTLAGYKTKPAPRREVTYIFLFVIMIDTEKRVTHTHHFNYNQDKGENYISHIYYSVQYNRFLFDS